MNCIIFQGKDCKDYRVRNIWEATWYNIQSKLCTTASYRRGAWEGGWYNTLCGCSSQNATIKATFSVVHTLWAVCTYNNGLNTAAQNVICSVSIGFSALLHKPSSNNW
jgi:hypothetical protein